MFLAHKIKDPLMRKLRSGVCLCCQVNFHTITRLHKHLREQRFRTVSICFKFYERVPFLDEQEYLALEEKEREHHRLLKSKGRRSDYAEAPAQPMIGARHPEYHFLNAQLENANNDLNHDQQNMGSPAVGRD